MFFFIYFVYVQSKVWVTVLVLLIMKLQKKKNIVPRT